MNSNSFAAALDSGAVLLMDGALGTELHNRGVPIDLPLWSANALTAHPDVVQAIHADYVAAGARIITANTFRTTTYAYRLAGNSLPLARGKAGRATKTALSLARRAAADQAWVAGSMAPVGDCYTPSEYPGPAVALATYRELADHLLEDGVDLLLLETHINLEECHIALQVARSTGVPVLVSFLVDARLHLWGGKPLAEACAMVEAEGASGVLVNCIRLETVRAALETMAGATSLPLGAYANAGIGNPTPDGIMEQLHPDSAYGAAVEGWVAAGARLIGGCCGTTPDTIRTLNAWLTSLDAPAQAV